MGHQTNPDRTAEAVRSVRSMSRAFQIYLDSFEQTPEIRLAKQAMNTAEHHAVRSLEQAGRRAGFTGWSAASPK